MSSSNRYTMPKIRLLHLLEELHAESVDVASLCIPAGSSKEETEGMLESVVDLKSAPQDLSKSIADSPTGAMLFWGPRHRYLIMPPFPINEMKFSKTCEIKPLSSLLHKEYLIGLVVVRLGEYCVGVFKGDKMLSSKVGTGLVHGRHHKGGSSAHRFERHREKQEQILFTRVCAHARELFEPYAGSLNYLVYGGVKETVSDFRHLPFPDGHGYCYPQLI